ncbi:MAG: hypothetical protein ACRECH_08710 [Nitrososphaerales archaeon]
MSNDNEFNELSDIYNVLKQDAKAIIRDLEGGVVMWREAAAGAVASTGFLTILILFYFKYSFAQEPIVALRWATLGLFLGMALVMAVVGAIGFRKYFQLRRKYRPLFARAKKL